MRNKIYSLSVQKILLKFLLITLIHKVCFVFEILGAMKTLIISSLITAVIVLIPEESELNF
jgi:hypothetical protein